MKRPRTDLLLKLCHFVVKNTSKRIFELREIIEVNLKKNLLQCEIKATQIYKLNPKQKNL